MSTDGNGFEVCEVATTDADTATAAGLLVEPAVAASASEAEIVCMKIWPLEVRTLPPALALRIWPRRTGGRIAEGKRWNPAG